MKICITTTNPNLDSIIDPRFGRCQYLLFVDSKTGKLIKAERNTGTAVQRGAGITTAQLVANNKPGAVISGNIGPNAFRVLQMSGIKIYTVDFNLTAEQALKQYQQGELKEISQATGPGHFGMGMGFGYGGQRGRGRGGRD